MPARAERFVAGGSSHRRMAPHAPHLRPSMRMHAVLTLMCVLETPMGSMSSNPAPSFLKSPCSALQKGAAGRHGKAFSCRRTRPRGRACVPRAQVAPSMLTCPRTRSSCQKHRQRPAGAHSGCETRACGPCQKRATTSANTHPFLVAASRAIGLATRCAPTRHGWLRRGLARALGCWGGWGGIA